MNSEQTILIVEDEKKIADLLSDYFLSDGFHPMVLHRGDLVLPFVQDSQPDLILLDVMLPGMDGITLCKKIREKYTIPVIMLTSRVEEEDILLGLQLGADDYICKPFSPREVVARVRTVLRRTTPDKEPSCIRIGPLCLNDQSRDITINHETIPLTQNEFGIIKIMMGQPGRVFSREELIKEVQGYEVGEYKRTIDTHIKNVRKKISSILPQNRMIVSVYGAGYKLDPDLG